MKNVRNDTTLLADREREDLVISDKTEAPGGGGDRTAWQVIGWLSTNEKAGTVSSANDDVISLSQTLPLSQAD